MSALRVRAVFGCEDPTHYSCKPSSVSQLHEATLMTTSPDLFVSPTEQQFFKVQQEVKTLPLRMRLLCLLPDSPRVMWIL